MIYYSVNNYIKDTYGIKMYKISLDAGFTCPNRDGRIDTRGCIFCSGLGSGDFAGGNINSTDCGIRRVLSISEQIELGKQRVAGKLGVYEVKPRYIAYFQAFTNTYASVDKLRSIYMEAVNHPDVAIISIATRPDCLSADILHLLDEINHIKPVWVELGLQTIHASTAEYIRRGYPLDVYDTAVNSLYNLGLHVITHVILGLPGESREMILETVDYVGHIRFVNNSSTISHPFGIKLQLLHVLRGTDLAEEYKKGVFDVLTMEEYVKLVADCIEILPKDMVIHRITGDGDKKTLLAPLWSGDKKRVLNALNHEIACR